MMKLEHLSNKNLLKLWINLCLLAKDENEM